MKWLVLLVAIVLGGAITWLLTVRRATRQVASSSTLTGDAVEQPAAEQPATERPATERPATERPATERPATERPASQRPADEGRAADEAGRFGGSVTHESSSRIGWDRTALDEDALVRSDPRPRDLEATDVLPIAGATPNGDLAGVTAPRADAGPPPTPADEVPAAETPGPERDAGQPGGGGPSAKDQET